MRALFFCLSVFAFLLPSTAFASRPIPVGHDESGYTGNTYFASVPYTRGYQVEVERNLTIRGIEIWSDVAPGATCVARVYDGAGTLRAEGPTLNGTGGGLGPADWWLLPVETEVYQGEQITFAVYCDGSSTTTFYEHRDPPAGQVDAPGYFTNILNTSFFGDGYPTGNNTWWGDWRISIEDHGLHDQWGTSSSSGTMSSARGAILTTSRDHSITGFDVYLDLDVGETCTPQIHDDTGTLEVMGPTINGAGGGYRWYSTDLALFMPAFTTHTVSIYCAQSTGVGWMWNTNSTYTLLDDAFDVHGRSGGGSGIAPMNVNSITPFIQLREGDVDLTNRDGNTGTTNSSSWSERTWGWRFTPDVNLTLHGIEVFMTRSSGTGHARVWETATGTLLGSSFFSIPTGTNEEWKLASLPNVDLNAGTQYTVGIYYTGGSTNADYYSGTSATYSRPGVLSNIDFCGSTSGLDAMPTTCTYNHRVERLITSIRDVNCDQDYDGWNSAACGGSDCNDLDATINPGAIEGIADGVDQDCNGFEDCWYDSDNDGFGDFTLIGSSDLDCNDNFESSNSLDCDDGNSAIYPGAVEIPADGVDQDCDTDELCYEDLDGDGFGTSNTVVSNNLSCGNGGESWDNLDCFDGDATIYPGAVEGVADTVDQDCDGNELCYQDADGDGEAGSNVVVSPNMLCDEPGEGWFVEDCNDTNASIYTGAIEGVADSVDQNCDGLELCYSDSDGDGYAGSGTVLTTNFGCNGAGEGTTVSDCNDASAGVNPGAVEGVADGVDQDCDGNELCYRDGDGDGQAGSSTIVSSDLDCVDGGEGSVVEDCDDSDASIYLGATEQIADGVDQDCDGLERCYADGDLDGFAGSGTVQSTNFSCDGPGEGAADLDCDDGSSAVFPGATELVADGTDQDCDGGDLCYQDVDGDTYGSPATVVSPNLSCAQAGESDNNQDCDDTDPTVNPTGTELPADGVDSDCDGGDLCYADVDGDSYGSTATVASPNMDCNGAGESPNSNDCEDSDASINPSAVDVVADGIDNDCDGNEQCYADSDGDGHAGSGTVVSADLDCTDPGEGATVTDCDDTDATVSPSGTELPADGVDSDCSGDELCYVDADGDLFGSTATVVSPDLACFAAGESDNSADCDDGNANAYPGAYEAIADGVDSDCNGTELCYADGDGDGFGGSTTVFSADLDCTDAGEDVAASDCDDSDNTEYPGVTWFADTDGDGYGDPGNSNACERAAGTDVLDSTDCDDTDPQEFPGVAWHPDADGDGFGDASTSVLCSRLNASDVPNGSDCDDTDPTEYPGVVWYADADGDSYGDANSSNVCERVNGSDVTNDGDCDDLDATEYPGVSWYTDSDGDGYGFGAAQDCERNAGSDVNDGTDCDDSDATENPSVTWFVDSDGDGYGDPNISQACERMGPTDVTNGTDCDDTDPYSTPTAVWYADTDGDGYGDPSTPTGCSPADPSDVLDNSDCDDADPDEFPGAIWYADTDGDGYGDPGNTANCERNDPTDTDDDTDCDDTDPDENPAGDLVRGRRMATRTATRPAPTPASGWIRADVLDDTDCDDSGRRTSSPEWSGITDNDADGYGVPGNESLCERGAPTDSNELRRLRRQRRRTRTRWPSGTATCGRGWLRQPDRDGVLRATEPDRHARSDRLRRQRPDRVPRCDLVRGRRRGRLRQPVRGSCCATRDVPDATLLRQPATATTPTPTVYPGAHSRPGTARTTTVTAWWTTTPTGTD